VAQVARALGIGRVLVPHAAGTLCAFGMTVTDVRHDHVATLHQLSDDLDAGRVAAVFGELEDSARSGLEQAGFAPAETRLERFADARYVGQVHELTVALPPGSVEDAFAGAVANAFHDEHERLYTYARRDLPVEVLHWRVRATGATPPPPPAAAAPEAPAGLAPAGTRDVVFADHGVVATAVYTADSLAPGHRIAGPAVVDGPTTTILAGPGDSLTVLDDGGVLIDVAPAAPRIAAPARRPE
jgi:N-methylhydantoinase A